MSAFRTTLLIALCLCTIGCAGAPPVSVHPIESYNDFRPEWAIVIIDLDLETSTSMINSSTLILPSDPTKEVFAIYADVEKPFKLDRLSVPARPGYSADLKFPNSRELPLPRSGIYYYGRVVQRGRGVGIEYDLNPAVISRAAEKYPFLFRRLEAVNFAALD